MKAIGCTAHGGPDVLAIHELPRPAPGPRDLLVRMHAAGFNPVDMKVVSGGRGNETIPKPALVPGFDGAGTVEEAGPECTRFRTGDAVYFAGDITRPGCHAEYVCVDERIAGRRPDALSYEEAAALPLTTLTAWESLIETMHVPLGTSGPEHTVLVVGGAGGVGSIAIQIAKRVCGLRVVATASRAESRAYCERLGADVVLDHKKDLREESARAGIGAYEYVLTTAGLDAFPALAELLAPLGRICSILPPPRPLDLAPLFPKRGTLGFELMFARPRYGVEPERQGLILDHVADLLDAGTLVSTLTRTIEWDDFRAGYEAMLTGHTLGKIVMRIP